MKFNKEEISLCKQIAEKHRKEIKYGDWFLNEGGFAKVWPYRHNCERTDVIPLWTISDCLEFLQKKEDVIELVVTGKHLRWFCRWGNRKMRSGKTPLEACLKAVLAVLEEGK
jgi:hypothetical protein